jgi:hypothetical protein
MPDNRLKLAITQDQGAESLSVGTVDWPSLPNGEANLCNIRINVAALAEVTRWAISKLSINDEPQRALTLAGLVALEKGLNAALAIPDLAAVGGGKKA